MSKFRIGRLDHVHIRVPDRQAAAQWYADYLGFKPVKKYAFWATAIDGGPLQISADGGKTMLALFEVSEEHPTAPQIAGVAFSLDAENFAAFTRSLPNGISSPDGQPLQRHDIVDLDMCWTYNFCDPWGNSFELNCYEYERIQLTLIVPHNIEPVRYWPRELYQQYRK